MCWDRDSDRDQNGARGLLVKPIRNAGGDEANHSGRDGEATTDSLETESVNRDLDARAPVQGRLGLARVGACCCVDRGNKKTQKKDCSKSPPSPPIIPHKIGPKKNLLNMGIGQD